MDRSKPTKLALLVARSGVAQRWTPFSPPLRLVIQRVITDLSISSIGHARKRHVISRRAAEEAERRYLRATPLRGFSSSDVNRCVDVIILGTAEEGKLRLPLRYPASIGHARKRYVISRRAAEEAERRYLRATPLRLPLRYPAHRPNGADLKVARSAPPPSPNRFIARNAFDTASSV
jgi:hypothetical protein